MKFFWKIFFTTMFISVACVALSGYWLITSSFHSQLENEVQTAQDYNEIIYYSLDKEFTDFTYTMTYSDLAVITELGIKDIAGDAVHNISINHSNEKLTFNILNEEQELEFSSLTVSLDKDLMSSTKDHLTSWTIKELNGKKYIQAMRPIRFLSTTFYIETAREVTSIFAMRDMQFEMMIKILIVMILAAGVLTFIISKLLIRRITGLTKVTQTISAGNLTERANAKGRDEIAQLSRNFNLMADNLEHKIHELQDEAERKERFVGSFSHELKTPLTSIIGYADLLRQKELDADQRNTCANYIFTEGKRLECLSMRLLELIVLKKQDLHPVPVSIQSIFMEVSSVVAPKLQSAGITMTSDLEAATILMEPELMKTVFINIIDNARNAIDATGSITITGAIHDTNYLLTIQDSGKGMKKENLGKITEAFYMVDKSRSRRHGGAGLGLAICSEILELHGFSIAFDSTPGTGTTVTIIMSVLPDDSQLTKTQFHANEK